LTQFLINQPAAFQGTRLAFANRQWNAADAHRRLRAGRYPGGEKPDIERRLALRDGDRADRKPRPDFCAAQTWTDAQPSVGTKLFGNPTLRNFEPRVGFAWNPRGGKTLFRGGFGIFDVLPLPYELLSPFQRALPFVQLVVGENLPAGSFPTGAFNQLVTNSTSGTRVFSRKQPKTQLRDAMEYERGT